MTLQFDKLREWQRAPAEHLLALLRSGQNCVDASDCGTGKCLGFGTRVLLYSGEIKTIENINKGDLLMGPDGTPREVRATSAGRGPLFKITPIKGEPWICNGDHILVLAGAGTKTAPKEAVCEISVNDFRRLPPAHPRVPNWKLFTSPGWERSEMALIWDPYIYGLWLGDGAIAHGGITTMDVEAAESWCVYFLGRGFRIKTQARLGSKASDYIPRSVARHTGLGSNEWWSFTQTSQLNREKFIRPEYLQGSRAQRLQLLAGLLDSDGYLTGVNGIEISQKSTPVAEGIAFLARSLGFFVTQKTSWKTCQTGAGGYYHRMYITGETDTIPMRVARRQAPKRRQQKRHNVFGFDISPAGEGDYFGVVLSGDRKFLLHDFTVTHNTYVAAAIASAMQVPTLVCAPKISREQWHQAAAHFGDTISFVGHEQLRVNSPYGSWQHPLPSGKEDREYFQCQNCLCKVDFDNYFPCHTHGAGLHCVAVKKKRHRYGRFIFSEQVKLFVLDEAHRFSAPDSLNADMLIAAVRQRIPTLMLSATLGTSPLQFRAIGYALGLHDLDHDGMVGIGGSSQYVVRPSFRRWAARYKVRPDPATPGHPLRWYAGELEQLEIMGKIRAEIIPARGVRVRKDDIPGFPEVDVTAELFDLDSSGQINDVYAEMHSSLAALADRSALDVDPESAITAMLRANQRVELLKVPLAVELATDAIEKGFSIGIFCNFQQTIDELSKRLKTECIVSGKHIVYRQQNIADFQEHRSRLILVNNACGGVALNLPDLDGNHPRGGLIFPSFKAVDLKQVVGRFPRESSKSKSWYKVLLAAGTGDVAIHRALRQKLNCLDALLDADLVPDNLNLTRAQD